MKEPTTPPKENECESESESENEKKYFQCSICDLKETYDYKGKQPPFVKLIKFKQDSYVKRDPFDPPKKALFLILGSDCSACNKPVCQYSNCSFFYKKTYCSICAQQHVDKFPDDVQAKLKKKLSQKT